MGGLNLTEEHQAVVWVVRASMTTSFFNWTSLLWLRQLQERIPMTNIRAQQDVNKLVAAIQFLADATLNAARFASKSMASSVAMHCLLWLCQWQVDVHHKWHLAPAPFKGASLFRESLDSILVETRDKRKNL